MTEPRIVHLHTHSAHSALDGIGKLPDIVDAAVADGSPAVAITDHGSGAGWFNFAEQATKKGIKPILGCLVAGQEIMTLDGMKPVEAIRPGDLVLTHEGRFRRVLSTMTRPYDGTAYRVHLAGRYSRPLLLTEEHPILVRNEHGDVDWSRPGDIMAGPQGGKMGAEAWRSYVCLPKMDSWDQTVDFMDFLPAEDGWYVTDDGMIGKRYKSKFRGGGKTWPLAASMSLNEDLAYLMGIYAAEGSLSSGNGRFLGGVHMAHHINEAGTIFKRVHEILGRLGIEYHWFQRARVSHVRTIEPYFNCLPLALMLAEFVGHGADRKRVPALIWNAPPQVRDAFVAGLIDGDGKTPGLPSNSSGSAMLRVTSPHLAWGFRTLIASTGHFVGVHKDDRKVEKGLSAKPIYTVSYNPDRSWSRSIEDEHYTYRPVSRIERTSLTQQVFNFEVEEDNSYVSDFVLHNCEAYLSIGSRHEHNQVEVPSGDVVDGAEDGAAAGTKRKRYEHLTMLAATPTGFANLSFLTHQAELTNWYKPRMDWPLLASTRIDPRNGQQVRLADGIIVGTGCLGGPVAGPLMRDDYDTARANTARMVDLFGPDGVFVEVMDHGIPAEQKVVADLVKIANEFGIPVVATNDAHYVKPEQATAHDVWLCVGETQRAKQGVVIRPSDTDRFKFSGTGYHLRTAAEMFTLFGDQPGTQDAVANSLLIADRIADNVLGDNHTRLPRYPLPAGFDTPAAYMHNLVLEGALKRYGVQRDGKQTLPPEVGRRLRFEEDTIVTMGYPEYFLIVWDSINWARSDKGLPTAEFPEGEPGQKRPILVGPGRGSAAGSVALYCMGITNVEPLKLGLLFERFLDPSRDDMPDIDTDFQSSRREEVVTYLRARYGSDHVARIGTWAGAWAKRAIKDVARVTDRSPLATLVTQTIHTVGKPEDTPLRLMLNPELLKEDQDDMGVDLRNLLAINPDAQDLVDLAYQVEGVVAGESIHACGIVIGDEPLPSLIPLRTSHKPDAEPDDTITAWDAHGIAGAGLVKFDFLSLNDLDVIDTCTRMVSEEVGDQIDIYSLPTDITDPQVRKTYDLLAAGKTAGVFQLASDGITNLTMQVAPVSDEDLMALIALYRPGPMAAGMHDRFVRRRNGQEEVDYGFYTTIPAEQDVIKEVLGSTLGVVAYQEQLMSLGRVVADFQPGQTNRLRKAFSKKKKEEMDAVMQLWIDGGLSNVRADGSSKVAFTLETLERLWVTFDGSAKYLFNACLTGDTKIVITKGTKQTPMTIGALYARLHGSPELAQDGQCPYCLNAPAGRGGGRCRGCCIWLGKFRSQGRRTLGYDLEKNRLTFQPIKDVHANGPKPVFEILLSDGRTVTATANHKFRGVHGFIPTDELKVATELTFADELMVQTSDRGDCSRKSRVQMASVISVTPVGEQETYDLEMAEGTSHTYLANGIVSHNSHSAGYGLVTYITAFLKANYPAQYGAALLNHVKATSREKRAAMLRSLRREGVTVLGPSVNDGKARTSVDVNGAVRIGMSEVVGGGDHARHIEQARADGGPFASLLDLSERVRVPGDNPYITTKLPSGIIEALIEAGALDDLGPRLGLKMALRAREVPDLDVPNAEWGVLERSLRERQRLGVLLSEHPMETLGGQVRTWSEDGTRKAPLTRVGAVPDASDAYVAVVGCVASVEEKTIGGGTMVKAVIEDETGSISVIFWPKTVRENADSMAALVQGRIVGVSGKTRVSEVFRPEVEAQVDEDGDDIAAPEPETQVEVVGFRVFTGELNDPDVAIYAGPMPRLRRASLAPPVESRGGDFRAELSVEAVASVPIVPVLASLAPVTVVEPRVVAAVDVNCEVWLLPPTPAASGGYEANGLRDRLMPMRLLPNMSRFPDLFAAKSKVLTLLEEWWSANGNAPGARTPEDLWVVSSGRCVPTRLIIEVDDSATHCLAEAS